mgnify:CR=1 FL=1
MPGPVTAFDFSELGDALKRLDVDRAVEIGRKAVEASRMLSETEEIALGRDLAALLLGAMPPLDDPAVQAYVNRLGLYLALGSERPGLPWRFIVTDSDSVGAFATPGGNVIVTAGLVRLMHDEHELAGVLAHEIRHVAERHHLVAIMQRARLSLAAELAENLAGEYAEHNPRVTRALLDAGTALYTNGLSQEDEFAADRGGMQTAAVAGYDPAGLMLALMTVDMLAADEPRVALLISTHPDTGERIDRLASELPELAFSPASTLSDTTRFIEVKARLNE